VSLPDLDSFVANEKKWNLDCSHVAVNNISTDVSNFKFCRVISRCQASAAM